MSLLDYWTQITLDSIWNENVQETREANITGTTNDAHSDTGTSDGWVIVKHTNLSEPFWGTVVNIN